MKRAPDPPPSEPSTPSTDVPQQERRRTDLEAAFLAAAVRSSEDAIIGMTPDYTVRFWNAAAERLYLYRAEDMIGQPFARLVPVGEELEHARHKTQLESSGQSVATETVRRRADGSLVDVSVRVGPVWDSAGRLIGYCSIARDIAAPRQAAAALRDSEARYRSLIEATAQIVWTNTPAGEMSGSNAAWGDYTGQTEKEYQGFGWANAVHPEDAQPTVAAWQEAVAARKPFLFEHRLRRHDGVYRTFTIRAVPVREADGTIREWVGVHTDVTEQRQTEEAARERTRLLALSAAVGRATTTRSGQAEMLQGCAEALVEHLDAAFARVWVLDEAEDVLVLRASAGMYTHLGGPHGRVPVGQFKIGLIAQERSPHLTNAVIGDPRVSDQDWARREGMVAFAGHPLVVGDRLVGVVALFARRPLTEAILQALGSVADEIAVDTDRRRTEEALRESEARKGAILTGALDCIITIDEGERVLEWNPAAEKTFGYARAQAVGRLLSELIIPHSLRGAHERGIAHFLKTGEGPVLNRRVEVPALRADGTEFPAELTAVPIRVGGRTLFTAHVRDLTERERATAQQRAFLRDVLASVTEGRLHLCHEASDLPAPLTPFGEPVPLSREGGLWELRHLALDAADGMADESRHDLATAASEAGMNAITHGGGGTGRVSVGADGTVQVRVEDDGAGISMENLPRATLSRGFSTKTSLGHGLKMMLETADRLYLLTGPTGTTVVLEQERQRLPPAWL